MENKQSTILQFFQRLSGLALMALALIVLVACGSASNPEVAVLSEELPINATVDELTTDKASTVPTNNVQIGTETELVLETDELKDEVAAGLIFMREEEKLARDVYLTLYEQWGLRIFTNIADAEQTHMDAVATQLERYELEDPTVGLEVGEFVNADLQALYDELVATGSRSLEEALNVGAAIEEIDILDLEEYLAEVEVPEIIRVYENLLSGSRNHLRAFTSTLSQQTGEIYLPQYLDQDAYAEIVGTEGPGNGRKQEQ
ncbi:MAG: DUF2202 domain-containing protein [Chloroflexota bacterium]|nr:DUF2202 domain-containing protein [Chloroflexota bacterium]